MALSQTAGRWLCGSSLQASSSRVLANAAFFSSRAAAEVAPETQGVAASVPQAASQMSTSAVAALAAKRAGLVGNGQAIPKMGSRAFSTFSSSAAKAAAVEAPVAEATQAKPSLLKQLARAAAVIFGAVAMAAAPAAMADAPVPWQVLFQDSATSTAQAQFDLHHDINFFLITILTLVLYMTFQIVTRFHYSKQPFAEKLTHHVTLEVLWTIIPTLIVLSIAIPSLTLIYSMDQQTDRPGLTVKIIGRQWYWSYEMHDHLQHKLVDPERLVALAEKAITK